MKYRLKILILSFLTLVFSNPFKEFDKSFLFQSSTLNLPNNWNIELKNEYIDGCVNIKKNLPPLEIEDRKFFCNCVMTEIVALLSEDELITEVKYITTNDKVSENLLNLLSESKDCVYEFIEEIRGRSIKDTDKNLSSSDKKNLVIKK